MAALVVATNCGGPRDLPPSLDPEAAIGPEELREEYRAAARASYAQAIFLKEQGDLEGARQLLEESLRLHGRDAHVRLTLAHIYIETGRMHEAVRLLQTATTGAGASATEHLLLARIQLLAGRADAALAGADSALALDSTRADAWTMRARLLARSGRDAEALGSFREALAQQPHDMDLLLETAACQIRLGDLEDAETLLRQALALDPGQVEARRELAAMLARSDRVNAAETVLRQGLAETPDESGLVEALLDIYVRAGRLQDAAALLQPYEDRGQLPPRLAYLHGRILMQLDRLPEAAAVLRPLVALHGARGIHLLLGDIAARLDRSDDAREHYRAARREAPDDCEAHTSLALLIVQEAQPPGRRPHLDAEAEAALDSVLQDAERTAGPETQRCQIVLGHTYSLLRRYADAVRHLDAVRQADADNRDVLFNLAIAHHELGHVDAALENGRALLQLVPEEATALNLVGYILADSDRELAESEALIRRALAKDPDNGYYVDSLGWVLYRKGEHALAAAELERAVRLTEEGDAVILEHLGDVYEALGDLEAAYGVYRRSRAIEPDNAGLEVKLERLGSLLGKP